MAVLANSHKQHNSGTAEVLEFAKNSFKFKQTSSADVTKLLNKATNNGNSQNYLPNYF